MQRIDEIEFRYTSPLFRQISAYAGKRYFIHFGQTPKMGVNVSPSHGDPAGVYFYPLDWLLHQPRFDKGEQYGTEWPFWTIVSLDEGHDTGVNLKRLYEEELDEIAERNRWPHWKIFKDQQKSSTSSKQTAGQMFWDYIRQLSLRVRGTATNDWISQNAALRGISYVYDDNQGIIHNREAAQLLVLDPRAIKVVATGQVKHEARGFYSVESREHSMAVLKELRGLHGGELTWKNKLPTLKFSKGDAQFTIRARNEAWTTILGVEAHWGRATKQFSLKSSDMANATMAQILDQFDRFIGTVAELAKRKRDLLFTPLMSEKDARAKLLSSLSEPDTFEIKTEIENDSRVLTVHAERNHDFGETKITTIAYATCRSNETFFSVVVKVNGYQVASARASEDTDMLRLLIPRLEESFKYVDPDADGPHFILEEEYRAFRGFLVKECGVKVLIDNFAADIEYWENYKDKPEVYRETKRVY